MSEVITLTGEASGKVYKLKLDKEDYSLSILVFLQKNDIPIASSCQGKKICKKCIINSDTLACSLTIKDFLEVSELREISLGYL